MNITLQDDIDLLKQYLKTTPGCEIFENDDRSSIRYTFNTSTGTEILVVIETSNILTIFTKKRQYTTLLSDLTKPSIFEKLFTFLLYNQLPLNLFPASRIEAIDKVFARHLDKYEVDFQKMAFNFLTPSEVKLYFQYDYY